VLLSRSPSHSPTAGGRSAEGSGPGAGGVSQPKVERHAQGDGQSSGVFCVSGGGTFGTPPAGTCRTNMGFGRHPSQPPGPSDAAIRTTPIRTRLSGAIPTRHTASAAPPCGGHPRLAEPDGFLDTEHDSADVSRMMDRMDVSHYRPGRLSATEEVAVDGHHHRRVDAMGPTAWCRSGPAHHLMVRQVDEPGVG
jgi:hypothetical protein